MIPLEIVFEILDKLRAETLELVENPPAELRTEFGFGAATGSLRILGQVRERLDARVEEIAIGEDE